MAGRGFRESDIVLFNFGGVQRTGEIKEVYSGGMYLVSFINDSSEESQVTIFDEDIERLVDRVNVRKFTPKPRSLNGPNRRGKSASGGSRRRRRRRMTRKHRL